MASGNRGNLAIAPYELAHRPVCHRTQGPNQPHAFLCFVDKLFEDHILDDPSLVAALIATYLKKIGAIETSVLSENKMGTASANFSGSTPTLWRMTTNHGCGLRTPDNQAFVHVVVQMDNSKVRDFYAVGKDRALADGKPYTETWNHEAWKAKYTEPVYYAWLARLFWETDQNDNVSRPWNSFLQRINMSKPDNSGLVRANANSNGFAPGWPWRCHRGEGARKRKYDELRGEWCSFFVPRAPGLVIC